MKAHALLHHPDEGLGSIATWLQKNQVEIGFTRLYAADPLPDSTGIELFILMGGPMSVNEEAQYPWLAEEKAFIRQAIAKGKAILGICLGAQVIASAMGASVYRNPCREIGWFPVCCVPSLNKGGFTFPAELLAFHWHGETFDLPAGAVQLARSQACQQQAFQVGSRVIGLQFHPEATPAVIEGFLHSGDAEPAKDQYVMSSRQMLDVPDSRYQELATFLEGLLSYLTNSAAD